MLDLFVLSKSDNDPIPTLYCPSLFEKPVEKPKKPARTRAKKADANTDKVDKAKEEKPKRASRAKAKPAEKMKTTKTDDEKPASDNGSASAEGGRKGWWQRTFG